MQYLPKVKELAWDQDRTGTSWLVLASAGKVRRPYSSVAAAGSDISIATRLRPDVQSEWKSEDWGGGVEFPNNL